MSVEFDHFTLDETESTSDNSEVLNESKAVLVIGEYDQQLTRLDQAILKATEKAPKPTFPIDVRTQRDVTELREEALTLFDRLIFKLTHSLYAKITPGSFGVAIDRATATLDAQIFRTPDVYKRFIEEESSLTDELSGVVPQLYSLETPNKPTETQNVVINSLANQFKLVTEQMILHAKGFQNIKGPIEAIELEKYIALREAHEYVSDYLFLTIIKFATLPNVEKKENKATIDYAVKIILNSIESHIGTDPNYAMSLVEDLHEEVTSDGIKGKLINRFRKIYIKAAADTIEKVTKLDYKDPDQDIQRQFGRTIANYLKFLTQSDINNIFTEEFEIDAAINSLKTAILQRFDINPSEGILLTEVWKKFVDPTIFEGDVILFGEIKHKIKREKPKFKQNPEQQDDNQKDSIRMKLQKAYVDMKLDLLDKVNKKDKDGKKEFLDSHGKDGLSWNSQLIEDLINWTYFPEIKVEKFNKYRDKIVVKIDFIIMEIMKYRDYYVHARNLLRVYQEKVLLELKQFDMSTPLEDGSLPKRAETNDGCVKASAKVLNTLTPKTNWRKNPIHAKIFRAIYNDLIILLIHDKNTDNIIKNNNIPRAKLNKYLKDLEDKKGPIVREATDSILNAFGSNLFEKMGPIAMIFLDDLLTGAKKVTGEFDKHIEITSIIDTYTEAASRAIEWVYLKEGATLEDRSELTKTLVKSNGHYVYPSLICLIADKVHAMGYDFSRISKKGFIPDNEYEMYVMIRDLILKDIEIFSSQSRKSLEPHDPMIIDALRRTYEKFYPELSQQALVYSRIAIENSNRFNRVKKGPLYKKLEGLQKEFDGLYEEKNIMDNLTIQRPFSEKLRDLLPI